MRHSTTAQIQKVTATGLFLTTQVLNVGVPLFFVISGFILSLPFAEAQFHLRKPVSLKSYFYRRVTRLEPPYLLCILLLFVLKIAAGRGTATDLLPSLIASSFYAHNFIFGRPSDINIVAWSLEIEIQFYILAPLLSLMFAIARNSVRRLVLVAAVLVTTALSTLAMQHTRLEFSLLAYGQFFLAGFLLAEFHIHKRTCGTTFLWDFVWTGCWLMLLGLLMYGADMIHWLGPWLILLLFVCAFQGTIANRLVTNQWIATIGGMCYSIYLLHNYVIAAVGLATEHLARDSGFAFRIAVQLLIMTPVVLAISALYFRFIERPCMNPDWIWRWSSQRRV